MTRYDQCDETCTVDCGHCKGNGPPRAANTPHEVEVARDWLGEVIECLNWPAYNWPPLFSTEVDADLLTVTDPFDAVNNETYFGLVYEWGTNQVTATAVSFMARRATWELMFK